MIKPPQIKRKKTAGKTARKSNLERKSTKFNFIIVELGIYLAIACLGLREPKINARQCESGYTAQCFKVIYAHAVAQVC